MAANPDVTILMSSTLSARNAEVSIKAMQAGAADCIQKPTASSEMTGAQEFGEALLDKVKVLGAVAGAPEVTTGSSSSDRIKASSFVDGVAASLKLRPASKTRPKVLAIGSSTGGPKALIQFFGEVSPDIGVPVVVTQHMPPVFTTTLAKHIDDSTGWECHEAADHPSSRM